MKSVDVKNHLELITRGAEEIIGIEDIEEKISAGKKLRVKFGADPTAPELHLGHAVVMEKLRQFQELGHTVFFIIGDFTALVGDPSGRTAERPVLTPEEVAESVKGYERQVFKILDREKTELLHNSVWIEKLGTKGLIELASEYTVARMLERNDFSQRYGAGNPISISEFLYPLLQGYDSVEVRSDIEIGGTDQKFNLLVGRDFQRNRGQMPQAILTMPLLEGTDGVRKMSKSYGNHIAIEAPPSEMFGKIMSVSDKMMVRYYALLTREKEAEVKNLHPMEAKKRLAGLIVERYHGSAAAEAAKEEFEKVFSEGQAPEDMPVYSLKSPKRVVDIIYESGLLESKASVKRYIGQGGVSFEGEKITEIGALLQPGTNGVLKIGKRKFLRVSDE